ncbi:MAG: hypothetical protein ABGY41_16260, partial [Candidatus Poribacteria bacterium]
EDGYVDLRPRIDGDTVYLATRIVSPIQQDARLFLDVRDSGRAWLNGRPLDLGAPTRSSLWGGTHSLRHATWVELRRGSNVLLVKVGGYAPTSVIAHFAEAGGLTCSVSAEGPGTPLVRHAPLWVPIADVPAEGEITDIIAIPDGRGIYAGTEGDGVLRFNEATRVWDDASDGLPTDEYVFVYDFLTLGDTLYAATSHGVYRLAPNSERWQARNGDLTDFYATAIAASDDWTFAGTWEGRIYRSPDRAESWEQVYGASMKAERVAAR